MNKYYTFFGCDQTKLPPGVISRTPSSSQTTLVADRKRRTDTTLINQKVEIYGHSLIITKRSRGEFNAASMN